MRYRRVLAFFSPRIELLSNWVTFTCTVLSLGEQGSTYIYNITEKVVAGDLVASPPHAGCFWAFVWASQNIG